MKIIKQMLITIAILLCSVATSAHDFEVDGIYYNITSLIDLTVEVTYKGANLSSYSEEYSGNVVIPKNVNYNGEIYSVTSIRSYAFESCSSLTSIEIPNSITNIESYAFSGCTSLKDLRIEDGETTLKLGYNVYSSSYYSSGRGLFIDCPLQTLYLGRNLEYETSSKYGYSPFFYNETLASVTIGNCVTGIGKYAFYDCHDLTSVTIGNSVTSIGDYSFCGCNITNITIPNSVTSIGEHAFCGCNFTSFTIPNSVTSIGNNAFDNCTSLKGLCIEDGETTLKLGYNCESLFSSESGGLFCDCSLQILYIGRNLNTPSNKPFSYNKTLASVTIGNSVTSISSNAFRGCTGLTSITIPNSVTSIGGYAFGDCSSLTGIIIPNSITSIDRDMFGGCLGLKSLVIPGSVKTIDNYAFDDCSKLSHLVLEAGTDTLFLGYTDSYDGLFTYCKIDTLILNRNIKYNGSVHDIFTDNKTLKYVEIGDSVTYIADGMFSGCSNILNLKIGKNLSYIGNTAFYECSGIKNFEYVCPGNARGTIGESAFSGCKSIETVHIGNAVIEGYAFSNCSNMRELEINDDVTSIGNYAFQNCTSLVKLKTGNGVRAIEDRAFSGCISLKEIIFGERVNYIGYKAFASCENIETIYALPKRAINCYESEPNTVFSDRVYKYATLYVGENSIDSYETKEPWSKFYIDVMKKYTLTYVLDDEVYKVEEYEFDEKIIPLITPQKEGYSFSGWDGLPETMPAQDIIVRGNFAINSYIVTYILNNEQYATYKVEYGASIPIPASLEKEGYTFSGWSEVPATMPANDIVISGTYNINTYKITYIVDGNIFFIDSIAYNDSIKLIPAPEKDGYTFSGWSYAPKKMPAEDITIIGSFVATGISNVSADAAVKVNGNSITLFGANNSTVAIYTANGALVEKIDCYDGEDIILGKGVYIVRVGGKAVKVKL